MQSVEKENVSTNMLVWRIERQKKAMNKARVELGYHKKLRLRHDA